MNRRRKKKENAKAQNHGSKKKGLIISLISLLAAIVSSITALTKEYIRIKYPEQGYNTEVINDSGTVNILESGSVQVNYYPETPSSQINDVSIDLTEIGLSYLKREELENSSLFLLNYNDFSASDESYCLWDDVATALTLYNNSDTEINIKEISFVAENICPLSTPELYLFSFYNDSGTALHIYNKSVTDIHNVVFDFSCNEILKDYFNEQDLKYSVSEIEGLSSYNIIVFPNNKMISFPEDIIVIENLNVEITFDEGKQTDDIFFMIGPNGTSGIEAGGIGENAYGILVNTDKPEYSYSQKVIESILPNRNLIIPVIFLCDKTCNFDFYLKVLVSNGAEEKWIESEHRHIFFNLDSLFELPDSSTFEFIPSENTNNLPYLVKSFFLIFQGFFSYISQMNEPR